MQQRDTLIQMLLHEEPELQTQAWELLTCLSHAELQVIADGLIEAPLTRWGLAARCLLPEPVARKRLREFTVCCALFKLERERRAGREPPEGAWIAVEWAAAGRPASFRREEWSIRETLWMALELDPFDVASPTFGEDVVDPEWLPDGWGPHDFYCKESRTMLKLTHHEGALVDVSVVERAEQGWRSATIAGRLVTLTEEAEEDHLAQEAVRAAGCALFEGWPSWDGDSVEGYPPAETLEEWRWQRAVWQRVVAEGQEGTSLIYGAASLPMKGR